MAVETKLKLRRAVAVARVSRQGDRGEEEFHSHVDQLELIKAGCKREKLKLDADVDVLYEIDVSGGAPLARRTGLLRAIELIEAGQKDVLVVAYFDRWVRSLSVQAEVVARIEKAGGAVLALDFGQVRHDTASNWLSSTMLGAVAEYQRRSTGERTEAGKRRAVADGRPPFPNLPPWLRRTEDGHVEHDRRYAAACRKAVELRAEGATIKVVQEYLRDHGIERSFHGVQSLLGSRLLLGELHFGEKINLDAFPPLVTPETWQRVQRMKLPRGRRPKSERLLARIGVLRCGSCGSRMVVGSQDRNGRRYGMYRCPPVGDCTQRVAISADLVEQIVTERVQKLLGKMRGKASVSAGAEKAAREVERAQAELDAAIRTFSGLDDESAVRERLVELRDDRDDARERLDELTAAAQVSTVIVDPSRDWDLLTLDERRALIRAVVESVTVSPGRSIERVVVKPRG
jgi:DNA invertase Pin-like site-specific DNA recombinase